MDIDGLKLEPFADYGGRFSRKISLNRSYGFGIPPAFFIENKLDENVRAVLFFDAAKKVVGIKFAKAGEVDDDKSFTMNIYGEGQKRGASFIARSFFNKFNLDPKKYHGRYEPTLVEVPDVGKVFLIELSEHTDKE